MQLHVACALVCVCVCVCGNFKLQAPWNGSRSAMLRGMFMHVHAGVVVVIIVVNMIHIYNIIICTMHLAMAYGLRLRLRSACALRLGFWNRDPNHGHPDANQAGPGSEPSWTRIRTKQTRIRMGVRWLSSTMIMLFGVLWLASGRMCYTRHLNSNSSCSNMQLASCLDKSKKKTKGAC